MTGAGDDFMRKVNLKDIEERVRQSPKGKFGRRMKEISVALGRDPESLDLGKRHPFDLALVRDSKRKNTLSLSFALGGIGALFGGIRAGEYSR